MQRLESFYKALNTILVVLFLSIEGYLIHLISEIEIDIFYYPFIIITFIVGLIIVFRFIEYLFDKLLEENSWVRSIILKDDFIEGFWIDRVEFDGVSCFGLISLIYEEGKYKQSGEQVLLDGTTRCSWNSVAADYENSTLKVIYHVKYFDENIVDQPYGISMYRFAKPIDRTQPLVYVGTFFDVSNNYMTKSVKGFKVTNKDLIKKLYNPDLRNEAVKELMNSNFFKKIE